MAIERNRARRLVSLAPLAAILLAVTAFYVKATIAIVQPAAGETDLLLSEGKPSGQADPARQSAVQTALRFSPLSQSLLNALAVERARASGQAMPKATADLLLRLGWRDATSLQNVAEVYSDGSNLRRLTNIFDGLMRRGYAAEPVIAVLQTMEGDPTYWGAVTAKLAEGPPWRLYYLHTTGNQLTAANASARLAMLTALQGSRHPPTDAEVAANLNLISDRSGERAAYDLWRRQLRVGGRAEPTRPLADRDFADAARAQAAGRAGVMYDWQATVGEDHGVSFVSGGGMDIEWNGSGLPVFATQRTSAAPAFYRLSAAFQPQVADSDAIGFRMRCPAGNTIDFVLEQGSAHPNRRFRSGKVVACAFPTLEIHGAVRRHSREVHVRLERLTLEPLQS